MKLKDERIIEFLWKSPVRSFEAVQDTLRYLDGQWIYKDLEYELFNEALGDNPDKKVTIRIPNIGGIAANALLTLTWHAKAFHLIRRRVSKTIDTGGQPDELITFYELTPAGKEVLRLLEAIVQTKKSLSQRIGTPPNSS